MKVAIIKYNAGNTLSVKFVLKQLGVDAEITDDPEKIKSADKVIFPGVGAANSAMAYLREHKLDTLIRSLTQPVLGICLGLQLFCNYTEEGDTHGLGIFDIGVKRFSALDKKVPHVGWNSVFELSSPLFKDIAEDSHFYFVHSYAAEPGRETSGTCQYGSSSFSAALTKNNFYATQFHPEKSGAVGEQLLRNFLAL